MVLAGIHALAAHPAQEPARTPSPIGWWVRNGSQPSMLALRGKAPRATGQLEAIPGPSHRRGAVRLGAGTTLAVPVLPRSADRAVRMKRWTLLMDLRIPSFIPTMELVEAHGLQPDGSELLVDGDGCLGSATMGFAKAHPLEPWQWRRVVLAVDNDRSLELYLDGTLVLSGPPQAADGAYALDSRILLGAGTTRSTPIDIAEVRLYDRTLTPAEVAALGACPLQAGTVICGPYFQNVTEHGITLMWETADPRGGHVAFRAPESGWRRVSSTSEPSGGGTWIHKAILDGLKPDTPHTCRVETARGPCEEMSFRTAPAKPRDFAFGVWGDSQWASPRSRSLDMASVMLRHMTQAEKVDLAVGVGDMQNHADRMREVRASFLESVIPQVGRAIPYYLAWGNHDGPGGPSAEPPSIVRRYADHPSRERPGKGPGHGSYAFDYSGCHFICLDLDPDWYTQAEIDWVIQDLQSPCARMARFIFVFLHAAPFYERWIEGVPGLSERLVPHLERAGVAAVFSGHVHAYERGFLNGVHYVTTGGSSSHDTEPLVRDWPHITVGGYQNPPPDPINHGNVFEYLKVEVSGGTCTVKMLGFGEDGTPLGVLDQFQIVR